MDKKYKKGLPSEIGGNEIASVTILDKTSGDLRVSTVDEDLIDAIKEKYPEAKTGPFGAEIQGDNSARDFRDLIALQQGELYKRGYKTDKHLQFGWKLFAAITVMALVGVAIIFFNR